MVTTTPTQPDFEPEPVPVVSAGRIPLRDLMPAVVPWPGATVEKCVDLLRTPDEDDLFQIDAMRGARAAVMTITTAFLDGRIRTWARPIGGGVPVALDPVMWEVDDPLPRFRSGRLNLEDWANPDAPATHALFASEADAASTFGAAQPDNIKAICDQVSPDAPLPAQPHSGGTKGRTGSFLRLPEVEARTGLRKSRIYELEKNGEFPKRFELGPRSVAWLEDEIEQWQLGRCRREAIRER